MSTCKATIHEGNTKSGNTKSVDAGPVGRSIDYALRKQTLTWCHVSVQLDVGSDGGANYWLAVSIPQLQGDHARRDLGISLS